MKSVKIMQNILKMVIWIIFLQKSIKNNSNHSKKLIKIAVKWIGLISLSLLKKYIGEKDKNDLEYYHTLLLIIYHEDIHHLSPYMLIFSH